MIKTPGNRNDGIKSARKGVYFVLFIVSLFVLIFSKIVIQRVSGSLNSSDWFQVDAKLLHASIEERQGTTSNSSRTKYTYYSPKILYEYKVEDQFYTGNRVSWLKKFDDGYMLIKAKEFKYKYKYNELITIYVNPENHADSTVLRDVAWQNIKIVLIACIVFWLLFWGCIYLLVCKLKTK